MKKKIVLALMMLVSLSMILSSFAHAQEEPSGCSTRSQQIDAYYQIQTEKINAELAKAHSASETQNLKSQLVSLRAEEKREWDKLAEVCPN